MENKSKFKPDGMDCSTEKSCQIQVNGQYTRTTKDKPDIKQYKQGTLKKKTKQKLNEKSKTKEMDNTHGKDQ